MRADRLIALLLLLQTRHHVTAAQVAQELEISERTARRDLEALAMSGVPIYSTPGRGGGWRLLGGAKTDLSGLTADEARALFLAAGPALENAPQLKSAMRKLSGALPETFRSDVEAAATAIKIDPAGWGQLHGPAAPHLDALTAAVVSGRQVELEYVSRSADHTTRIISPLGLVTKRGVWYVVSNTAAGLRTFRLTRIKAVTTLDTPVDRPLDFDLEVEWERIVGEVESRLADISVDIVADPTMLRPLRFQFTGRIVFHDPLADGRIRATVSENGATPLAAQLAGFGNFIEVIDPPDELSEEFRRIAGELHERWLTDSTGDLVYGPRRG